ncbi:MAG: hypothetical protein JW904_01220 [Spirochaetales bacterium]|nr:hypothetical protein [Spirochaetales bacterium]
MKYQRILCLVLVIYFVAGCASAPPSLISKAEYERLAAAVEKWYTIAQNKNEIILTSKEMCWFYYGTSLPAMTKAEYEAFVKETGWQGHYVIRIVFVPRWTKEQLCTADESNFIMWEKLDALPKKHGVSHLRPARGHSFIPETKEDEARVAAYDKEYMAIRTMHVDTPESNTKNYSIFLIHNNDDYDMYWENESPSFSFSGIFDEEPIK